MTNEKILQLILSGLSDNNIKFRDMQAVLDSLGFSVRINGDHHVYFKDGIPEIINLQPRNGMAKGYQVKQVRNLILKYRLSL